MSETCKECGYEVHDGAQVCPNCGSPMGKESVSDYMDDEVLAQGMSTDAESTLSIYARIILIVGQILVFIYGILLLVFALLLVEKYVEIYGHDEKSTFLYLLAVVIPAIITLILWFLVKVAWAAIMIYVNISTTLKRIEIKLEKYGTK